MKERFYCFTICLFLIILYIITVSTKYQSEKDNPLINMENNFIFKNEKNVINNNKKYNVGLFPIQGTKILGNPNHPHINFYKLNNEERNIYDHFPHG